MNADSTARQVSSGDAPDRALIYAELGKIVFAETSVEEVLDRVVNFAKQAIPATSDASITLLVKDQASSAAYTGPTALELDEGQYERGHGPCLDSVRGGDIIGIPDMAKEERWPDYTPRAVALKVHSSLSVPLPVQQHVLGGLNLYSTEVNGFDDAHKEIAATFADYAAVAVANAHLYASTAGLAEDMRTAMQSRAVIEQAKGIIMAQRRCSPDEAFQQLSAASQHSNRKLRDVAAALVARAQDGKPPR